MAEFKKEGYIFELFDLKNKLNNFIEYIKQGESTYIKEVAVKLRMLYSDVNRISQSPNNAQKSLIEIIAELFNIKIEVYTKSFSIIQRMKEKGIPLPTIRVESAAATWFERGDTLTDIKAALSKELIYYYGREYSFTELFRIVADKLGGCHIDKFVDDNVIKLYSEQLYISGSQVLIKSMLDMAIALVKLIEMIEEFINNGKESRFVKKK